MSNDWVLCQLHLSPAHFKGQREGWVKGGSPASWNLYTPLGHTAVTSSELWLKGKQGRAEVSQARMWTATEKQTMIRNEDRCLSLRCIGLWNNLPSLKPPKKKWELVFLPWWDWASCGQPASQESNSGSPLSCQFWPVRSLRMWPRINKE